MRKPNEMVLQECQRAIEANAPARLQPLIEAGVSGYEMGNWYGLLMPAATPQKIVGLMNARINDVLKRPDTRTLLARVEVDAIGGSMTEFAKFIGTETVKFAALIKRTGIKAE